LYFEDKLIKQLDIVKIGEPILKQIAEPVSDTSADIIQTLIDDMLLTLHDSQGVGIAAPQVNKAVRVIIVASHPNARYPDAPSMEPLAMINPLIISVSKEQESGWEGCLSVPGKRGLVARATSLRLRYLDRNGALNETEYMGFLARIVQHEVDHLDGICFVDRVKDASNIISEEEYFQIDL